MSSYLIMLCDIWQVADVLATFLVRNRFAVATDNFKWYLVADDFCFRSMMFCSAVA